MKQEDEGLRVQSVAFANGGHIPPKYTCEGENVNPPLEVRGYPSGTKSLAIIMEDPDAPRGVYDHWIVWNIPPNESIAEGSIPGTPGKNSFGNTGYGGPCPPNGSHRYFFRVYALDSNLDLAAGAGKEDLRSAMQGHVVAQGELMAHYKKRSG
jgi:Raf kinase inhibitor-like YbhB/YbcL family protein